MKDRDTRHNMSTVQKGTLEKKGSTKIACLELLTITISEKVA